MKANNIKMLLYLNSEKADNNVFKLDEAIVGKYKLQSFSFTNNMYNVNDTNNKIYINENGDNLTATLTNGYYDINDLKTHLSTVLNSTMSGTVTITLNSNTNKYTIANTLNYYFTFGSNTLNSARKLIGFNAVDGTNATSHTSDVVVDLNPCREFFINIVENDYKNIYGQNYFNSSLFINGIAGFGETMRYINDDNFNQYITLKNTKSMCVEFHDLNENEIDLNSDYSIVLQKI